MQISSTTGSAGSYRNEISHFRALGIADILESKQLDELPKHDPSARPQARIAVQDFDEPVDQAGVLVAAQNPRRVS